MENKYKWSAKYNAFFPVSLLPSYELKWQDLSDLVDIDDDVEAEFNGEPPTGKQRIVVNGLPAWGDIPAPTYEQQIASAAQKKNSLRTAADSEIAWLQDAVDAGIATDEETALLASWKNYRVLLMRVDTSKAPDIEWSTPPAV